MLNRRIASLIAALTVAGLATAGCAEQSAAVRVDDATVSASDFEDQLDEFYENDDLRGLVLGSTTKDQLRADGDPRSSYTQEYVGVLARLQVQFLVVAQVLDEEGIEITDDDRAGVLDQLDQGLPAGADSLPAGVRDDLVEGFAGLDRLRAELGEDEFTTRVGEVADEATIVVNSRYGSWDTDQFRVTPPEGPAAAPGSADEATGQSAG